MLLVGSSKVVAKKIAYVNTNICGNKRLTDSVIRRKEKTIIVYRKGVKTSGANELMAENNWYFVFNSTDKSNATSNKSKLAIA